MCFPMLRTHHGDIRRREVQVVFSEIIFENLLCANSPTRANLDETKQMPSRMPLLLHLALHRPDQLKKQPNNDRGDETLVPESKLFCRVAGDTVKVPPDVIISQITMMLQKTVAERMFQLKNGWILGSH